MEKNGVPEFESEMEAVAWSFKQLSEAVKNLASRIAVLETAFNKLPPPGADMVKYKIPGNDDYSNLKELFDNCLLYTSPSPRDGLLSRMPSSA